MHSYGVRIRFLKAMACLGIISINMSGIVTHYTVLHSHDNCISMRSMTHPQTPKGFCMGPIVKSVVFLQSRETLK
jgi:hypothetical protein